MKKNMGNADKIIRIIIAAVIGGLYFMGQLNGVVSIVLLTFATIFILTSLIGTCPLYSLFGISTRKVKEALTFRSKM